MIKSANRLIVKVRGIEPIHAQDDVPLSEIVENK